MNDSFISARAPSRAGQKRGWVFKTGSSGAAWISVAVGARAGAEGRGAAAFAGEAIVSDNVLLHFHTARPPFVLSR